MRCIRKCRAVNLPCVRRPLEIAWHAGGTVPAFGGVKEATVMNLVVWLPAMFLLGLVTMALCYAFIGACEKI